jgi:hypothetical protein
MSEGVAVGRSSNEEDLLKEYYEILKIVGEFDGRLLTVKGWGVTLSLASLAWGFQQGHFGLFLVAALSGLGFWLIEGTMKRHQMRHCLRMRQIEVLQYQRSLDRSIGPFSSPRIDSSWSYAGVLYKGGHKSEYLPAPVGGPRMSYQLAWFFPHVFLPHLVSLIAGITLLALGIREALGRMTW